MSYASAQTNPPAIRLRQPGAQLATARTLYDGFRIRGGSTVSNSGMGDANMVTRST